MSEPSDQPAVAALATRFARLVAAVESDPAAAVEHRAAVQALAKSLGASSGVELTRDADGTLCAAGEPLRDDDAPTAAALELLTARFTAYGLEALTLGKKAASADLSDLAKLFATAPTQADPPAFFAARAAVIDARNVPRRYRPVPVAPDPEPLIDEASAEPIVERSSAAPEAVEDARSEPLTEALAIPETSDAALAALFDTLQQTDDVDVMRTTLLALTQRADLSFRTGNFERLADALAGLIAIEFQQLVRDSREETRREFTQAVRRLASPVILRQIAVLRHQRAASPVVVARLQAILSRFGTDGADALIDEWTSVASPADREICLAALRQLRRTHDALFTSLRDTNPVVVRQAAQLLGDLGDPRAEQLLIEQIRHPDARTRRAVVAALERFDSPAALDAISFALLDEEPTVRVRAVAAAAARGAVAVRLLAPLVDAESDREVLYTAIAALGRVGTPEGIQLLIRAAAGETAHPLRRSAGYRLQACSALVQLRTPQTMAAVQGLRDDRDREVREGSQRLVAQAARRATTSIRAVAAP